MTLGELPNGTWFTFGKDQEYMALSERVTHYRYVVSRGGHLLRFIESLLTNAQAEQE